MTIEEILQSDEGFINANVVELDAAAVSKLSIEQAVRQQLNASTAGEETSDETRQMLEQKFGLAPIKFTRIEEKVIRKQNRKEERIKETQDAGE